MTTTVAFRIFPLILTAISFGLSLEENLQQGKRLIVGVVSSPPGNFSRQAFDFILEFANTKIMPDGWKMEFRFVPESGKGHLLSDVTGAGLYLVAECLDFHNVSVFVGPGSSTQTKVIHPFAVKRGLPHIAPFATDPALQQSRRFAMLIRLSPPDTFQTKAVLDMLQFYGWNRVSLITIENDYGFGAESSLLRLAASRGVKVEVVSRFQIIQNAEDIPISEALDEIQPLGAHPVVVVTGAGYGKVIMKAAYMRGMVVARHWLWMLMDGVAVDEVLTVTYHTADGRKFERFFDGLVGTRPVMSEGRLAGSLKAFWNESRRKEQSWPWQDGFGFDLEMNFDAIVSIAHGFRNQAQNGNLSKAGDIDGRLLREAILQVRAAGLTTEINFGQDGKTKSTEYDIFLSAGGKWNPIGEWSDITKLNMSYFLSMNYSKALGNAEHDLGRFMNPRTRRGRVAGRILGRSAKPIHRHGRVVHASSAVGTDRRVLHIVTILESPFVMLEVGNQSTGRLPLTNRVYSQDLPPNERKPGMDVQLHGYCIDMLQKLCANAGLMYTLKLVDDSKYGGYDEATGGWNGMIGDVEDGRAHAAVAPITVTDQRAEYVDFTTPFMEVGLKFIVDRKAAREDSQGTASAAFAFLLPFHENLYLAIALCVVCLAVFLNLLSSLSPYGTRGHFFLSSKVDQLRRRITAPNATRISTLSLQAASESQNVRRLLSDREEADRAMAFNNALYFVWASLFWQTPERVPRAPCARFITGVWYLAAVVFVASYTANMVAFVSSRTRSVGHLDSISGLVSQTRIPYGTVTGSSVEFIFQSSDIMIATHIHDYLQSDPERLMVPASAAGMKRVKNGTYALLWDSLMLDFEAAKSNCRLKTVNVGFGGVGYAVALSKHSSLTSLFSRHILGLKESGYLAELWKQYFSELDKCAKHHHTQDSLLIKSLRFQSLAGVFYVVFLAMGAGLAVLICEWLSAAFFDVDKNDPLAPQTLVEALRIRFQRLKQDIIENWLPRVDLTVKTASLEFGPASEIAMSVVSQQLKKKKEFSKGSHPRRQSKVDKLRGFASEIDLRSPRIDSAPKEEKKPRPRRFSMSQSIGNANRRVSFTTAEDGSPVPRRRYSLANALTGLGSLGQL